MNRFEQIIQKLEDMYNDSILDKNETNVKHALIAAECENAFRELAGMYGTAKRELSAAHRRIGALNKACEREDAYWMLNEDGEIVCSHCGVSALRQLSEEQEQSDFCPNCGQIMKQRSKYELQINECPHCGGIARYEIHTAEDRYDIFTIPTVLVVCEDCGCKTNGTQYNRDATQDESGSLEKAMQTEKCKWNGERE